MTNEYGCRLYYCFHGDTVSSSVQCRLFCFHGKRLVSIEYGTDYIAFMANVLSVLSTVVDKYFHGKRVVNIEDGYRLYSFHSKCVSIGCRDCIS